MTTIRRLLTTAAPALRSTTRPAPAAVYRHICESATSAHARRTLRQRQTVPSGAVRRWYSTDGNAVPGSRIWSFDEIRQLVDSPGKTVIVDVREPLELQTTGKIPGAINIPVTSAVQGFHVADADFEDMYGFARPSRDTALLFYCKAGVRARSAAALAKQAGWQDVGEYPGSWLDWEARKGPVERVKSGDGPGQD
ncbi:Rhodanese domain protein [Metarhizium rileyi]|uniref:Rhodanese domain protein n=1 Tax=Metarhizium rileyi (strain RCEF 4871) TaxID=1649241 RepID=A0A167EUJ7_METRR|nr:Rhodanese domain protein [Metarhizium rileyi RCEF 4871]